MSNSKVRATLKAALQKIADDERINDFGAAFQALDRLMSQVLDNEDPELSEVFKHMHRRILERHDRHIDSILRDYGSSLERR